MRRPIVITILVSFALLWCPCFAQHEGARKIIEKVVPAYPAVARNMHISGTVKLEALVSAAGIVKSIEVRGGHPMLAQAAADAVTKWRWDASSHETYETVEVKFGSQ
jgi:TonB family protein